MALQLLQPHKRQGKHTSKPGHIGKPRVQAAGKLAWFGERGEAWRQLQSVVTAWLVVRSQGQERGRARGQESIQVLADTDSTWAKSPWSGQSAVSGGGSIPL